MQARSWPPAKLTSNLSAQIELVSGGGIEMLVVGQTPLERLGCFVLGHDNSTMSTLDRTAYDSQKQRKGILEKTTGQLMSLPAQ